MYTQQSLPVPSWEITRFWGPIVQSPTSALVVVL
jgi:hypothetical protein